MTDDHTNIPKALIFKIYLDNKIGYQTIRITIQISKTFIRDVRQTIIQTFQKFIFKIFWFTNWIPDDDCTYIQSLF